MTTDNPNVHAELDLIDVLAARLRAGSPSRSSPQSLDLPAVQPGEITSVIGGIHQWPPVGVQCSPKRFQLLGLVMRMSKFILVAVACLGVPSWAADGNKTEKGPFYLALASMAPEAAAYTFLLDQHLELKCGRGQSIDHLKTLGGGDGNMLRMILALKAGNAAEARNMLASLPCQDSAASTKQGAK